MSDNIANTTSNVDMNKNGRNKYSTKSMYRKNQGLLTLAKWIEQCKKTNKTNINYL
jgi:hypothetical protein